MGKCGKGEENMKGVEKWGKVEKQKERLRKVEKGCN